jgi:Tol biopolymer transport system component
VTGKVLALVRPPLPFTRFSEVAAAPDDHTFVLAGIGPQGQPSVTQLYALRLNPATGSVRLSRLPVPLIPERWRVNALAVSPDGTRLAVALEPPGAERPRLQLYSMTSGVLLREWGVNTSHPGAAPVIGFMSWSPDGRTLEYSYPLRGNGTALLDVTRPGTNLLGNSTIVQFPKWADLTYNLTLTGGGRLIASAAYVIGAHGSPSARLVAEFSATTGKAVHVFHRQSFHGDRQAMSPSTVWWASPSGQVLIASPTYAGVGVFTGHRYIPLPWSRRITEAAW